MEFRILGPLQVLRDGSAVEPGSPKQRALLANLVIHHGRAVPRDRLIEDLWAGSPPATALGVLQNYVSQLRRTLGAEAVATRGHGYVLDVEPGSIDAVRFEELLDQGRVALAAGEPAAASALLRDALGLWHGPALADVAAEPFAQAEIGRLQELRAVALELALEAEVAAGRHREAVADVQAAVAEHPYRERLWWLLMLALHRSGRQAEALGAYQRARAVLSEELGLEPGSELRDLEAAILGQRPGLDGLLVQATPASTRRQRHGRQARRGAGLVGRVEEQAAIAAFLDEHRAGLLLLVGEPGIGKTRLLEEARRQVEDRGGLVVAGRGFEAEHGRPYGAWVDALRNAGLPQLDAVLRARLGALLPEMADAPVELDDPNRLYDAVVHLLRTLADGQPVAVLVDDAHWLDEASFSLLHFAIRHLADADVAFLASARPAELHDNPVSAHVMQGLRRDDVLTEVLLGPLQPSHIAELTHEIAPDADAEGITEATHGNPLFALEMARALARGDEPLSSRIDALIGDRLARLDDRAGAVVPWVAAFGRGVPPAALALLVEQDPVDLFAALGDLERHGVLHADDEGSVHFVHDLVRNAAYQRLSAARRAMLHARIGAVLAAQPDPDDTLAADTARHADLGADSATCAAACARAARRCLRLLAYSDAEALVVLGRTHARRLPPEQRVVAEIELIHLLLTPGLRLHHPGELTRDLTDLCAEAQRLGLDGQLSSGLSLLARAYHWGWGDIARARALMQRATTLIEAARAPDLEPLLEGARCLAYLEIDMARTAVLFDELGALHALAEGSVQYQWGLGLVQAWRGDAPSARVALGRAIELATSRGDHWVTFECMARLTLLELEAGDLDQARRVADQLQPVADKLGQGSERSYAAAITALCRLDNDDRAPAGDELDDAVRELERIDARFLVPDLHGIAAELLRRAGHLDLAEERAARAVRIADEVKRPFEAARAHALLACIAAERGDDDAAHEHLAAMDDAAGGLPGHVEGLRRHAEGLLQAPHGNEGT